MSTKRRLDRSIAFINERIAAGDAPGAVLVVSDQGRIVCRHVFGSYCGLPGRSIPLTLDVLHPTYSYGKLISSTVLQIARQEGVFEWDRPVSDYIPEFRGGGKEAIIMRHLVTHSAGIPSVPMGPVRTRDEWNAAVKAACDAATEWTPGSRCYYHALSGHLVAAEVVLRRTHAPDWQTYCEQKLFRPIGAKSITFRVPSDATPTAITPQPKDIPSSLKDAYGLAGHPAGGAFSTAEDAWKVLQLHLNGGIWRGKRLLQPEMLNEMHTVQYQREIDVARRQKRQPAHEPWGLGILLRGADPAGGNAWFGFRDQNSPGIFGHAGINTVIGVADMNTNRALFFATTGSPATDEITIELRNGVTNRVMEDLT